MRSPLFLPLLLAAVLVACGGGKGNDNGNATATAESGGNSASTTPVAAPTDSGTPVPDPFADLQSYHYEMDLLADASTSIKINGTVKAPDSIRMDFYLADSTTPISSLIIVGSSAWSQNEGDTSWQSIDIAEAQGEVAGLLPKDFWGTFPIDQLVGLSKDQGQEDVNGVKTQHYQISEVDADTMQKLLEIFGTADSSEQPTNFTMDLWRAIDGGWPAKADINVGYPSGSEVTNGQIKWEMKDVNAVTESIQPPQ
jgi:hypothetical protein